MYNANMPPVAAMLQTYEEGETGESARRPEGRRCAVGGLGENVAAEHRCGPEIMAVSDHTHYALTHTQEEIGLKRLRTLM